MARFNWNRRHEDTLRTLYRRHRDTFDGGRKVIREVNGRRRRLTERQYVIFRFRATYLEATVSAVSDQAIWAKYQRINGQLGNGARKVASAHNVQVAATFTAPNGMVFTPGMNMRDWSHLGLELLGSGVSRRVYDLGDYVLKVSRGANGPFDGHESQRREVGVWKKAGGTDDAKFFAKIFAADPDFTWVIAEKVDRIGWPKADDHRVLERVAHKYGVSDIHGANVGVRADGSPVLVDYASA